MYRGASSPSRVSGKRLPGGQAPTDVLVLREVLPRAPQVLADRDPVALELVVVSHEPGHILCAVLAGLCGEVAEPPVQLDPHPPTQALGVAFDRLVEAAVEVLAVMLEAQHERLMVEAGGEKVDLLHRHSDDLGQLLVGVLDRMTQPDHVRVAAALPDRPREHRHRVGVVEQDAVRAQLGHVVRDRQQDGDRPQPPEDTADPQGVADRLAQAVPSRDLEVAQRCLEPPDLDLVDDEVRPLERGTALEMGLDLQVRTGGLVDRPGDLLGRGQALSVDVVQDDRRSGELGEIDQIREEDTGELNASCADQSDPRHVRDCFSLPVIAQECARLLHVPALR